MPEGIGYGSENFEDRTGEDVGYINLLERMINYINTEGPKANSRVMEMIGGFGNPEGSKPRDRKVRQMMRELEGVSQRGLRGQQGTTEENLQRVQDNSHLFKPTVGGTAGNAAAMNLDMLMSPKAMMFAALQHAQTAGKYIPGKIHPLAAILGAGTVGAAERARMPSSDLARNLMTDQATQPGGFGTSLREMQMRKFAR